MKKFFKVVLIIILIGVVSVGGYFVYTKFFMKKTTRDAFATIPDDAIFIVETTDLSKAWTDISESDLWQYLIKTAYFEDINKDLEMVDKYLKSNKIASLLLKNRKLIMSAHMTSAVTWDFLITVDLKDVAGQIESLESAIGLVPGYKMKKREFKGIDDKKPFDIIELTNETNPKEKIFISFVDNIILVSFTGTIIEKAIEQKNDNHWNENNYFTEIMNDLASRELFKLYFSYAQLNKFSQSFLTTEDDVIKLLSESLAFSIFDLNIQGKKFSLSGFTNLDSANSYVRALVNVQPGKMRAYEIMTDQTAAYLNICFNDYMLFYNNLLEQFAKDSPEDIEEIEKYKKKLDNIFKIDIEQDLFSWIGQEIAIFKVRPLSANSKENDIAIAIHAKDINDAKEGLDHITKQIKKWTRVKFDIIEYKNFEINHIAEKGIINMLLNKLMEGIDKPYFTYIEDYVVFSNSQEVLIQVIDDYIAGNTLSHNEKFQSFIDEFSNKSNISAFIQMPKMFTTLYFYTPDDKKDAFKENKELILSFARVGFQLESDGKKFKTTLLAEYDETALLDDDIEKLENQTKAELFNTELETLDFKIELTVAEHINGQCKKYFDDDSTRLRYEGNIEDNKIIGLWRSYYESGNIKNSVTYSDDKINGEAYFYYDDEIKTKKAVVQFEDDQIIDEYQGFYENGAQKTLIKYKKGQMDGEAQFYYKTGRIKIEGNYKDGLKHGKWVFFDESGEKIKKENWKKGVKK